MTRRSRIICDIRGLKLPFRNFSSPRKLMMIRGCLWTTCLLLLLAPPAFAEGVFPGAEWQTDEPANQGVDATGLEKAKEWLATHNSKSGLVIRHGRIVAEWYF